MNVCRPRWTVLGLVLLAAVPTACGGQEPASTAEGAGATPAQSSGTSAVKVSHDNPCSVLLPQEVESMLGVSVPMREIVDEVTCRFPFDEPPPAASKAAPPLKAPANDQEAEEMAKSMAAAMSGGPRQLVVKVYWKDGRTTIAATKMAASLLGSFEQLQGIGDEAWLGPMASTLVFVKGDTGVELDLRMVPDGRKNGIRLAKLIASRI